MPAKITTPTPSVERDANLTRSVKAFVRRCGADLVGIADAVILDEALPEGFRPADVLPGCCAVVTMALQIPDMSLELMRHGVMNFSYNLYGYAWLNRELDYLSYRLVRWLDRRGWAATPLPARGTQYHAKKPQHGPISYRHCAVAAGLATFGLNGLALTPEFGVRQRFIAVPTTAPLVPAKKLLDQSLCDGCLNCIRACPAHALSLNPPHVCRMGGRVYRYARVDAKACLHSSHGLDTSVWKGTPFAPTVDVPEPPVQAPGEHFRNLWSVRDPAIQLAEHGEATFGATLCGRCLAWCTAGHDAMNRRLRPGQTDFQGPPPANAPWLPSPKAATSRP